MSRGRSIGVGLAALAACLVLGLLAATFQGGGGGHGKIKAIHFQANELGKQEITITDEQACAKIAAWLDEVRKAPLAEMSDADATLTGHIKYDLRDGTMKNAAGLYGGFVSIDDKVHRVERDQMKRLFVMVKAAR